MNRTKISTTKMDSPAISSNLMTRIAVSQANGSSASKKLRTELRRVMSDRVLKITRCSQQQTVDKIKQRTELNNSKNFPNDLNDSVASQNIEHSNSTPNFSLNQSGLNSSIQTTEASISLNTNTNNENYTEPVVPTFTDKTELVEFIKKTYNQLIEKNTALGQTVQEISTVIKNYAKANNLEAQQTVSEILKENLIQTVIQLKQRFIGNENSENLKIEVQIQILLVLEEYINLNTSASSNKVKVDDDFVWEVANSVRWLSQNFKEKFKIEKFLFGEIYPTFNCTASELLVSLMEELGYDKDDNLDESGTTSNPGSASNSLLVTPNKSPSIKSRLAKNENNYSQFNEISSITNPLLSSLKDEANNCGTPSFSKVNSLFEDFCPTNDAETNENDEVVQSQKLEEKEKDSDDLLDDFKKKKPINRFSSFSGSSTAGRSIVVQSKKRMKLKIRSPCKEPPNPVPTMKRPLDARKSPRIKDRQILTSTEDDNGKKRPKSYLITDTPDHKQNTTIIRTKQEKIRKRFSFQPLNPNSNTNTNTNSLPVIPDTPVKNDNRFLNNGETAPPIGIISSRGSELFKTKIYSSPSKMFSPQKKNVNFE